MSLRTVPSKVDGLPLVESESEKKNFFYARRAIRRAKSGTIQGARGEGSQIEDSTERWADKSSRLYALTSLLPE